MRCFIYKYKREIGLKCHFPFFFSATFLFFERTQHSQSNQNYKIISRLRRVFSRGFTLIELMMAVAIIGILATLALPAYQDYIFRAKMAEVIMAGSDCRTAISEYYQLHGSFAIIEAGKTHTAAYGCQKPASPTRYVGRIEVEANGVIRIVVNSGNMNYITGAVLLTPTVGTTQKKITSWNCEVVGNTKKFAPASCR